MNNVNANAEAYINSLDTYIDVLREESTRLSNMITKLNDEIQEAETKKEQLVKEQNEPKFKITRDEKYYFVDFRFPGCKLDVKSDVYMDALIDKNRVDQNNCFKTKERAKEVLDKIELLLKLERLHDIYCPDYKPDWVRADDKHYALYDKQNNKYVCDSTTGWSEATTVFFPTEEIAQKVCDILNKEREDYDNS